MGRGHDLGYLYSENARRVLAILAAHPHGMTWRQIEAALNDPAIDVKAALSELRRYEAIERRTRDVHNRTIYRVR